ncbi:MAG: hypothetical protein IJK28_05345 [Clostridia bacterium]|nr:hypothetical protein [Clostridia bacterium]MBQ6177842.1 hypothetical protein [Bacteroidales bacterium]
MRRLLPLLLILVLVLACIPAGAETVFPWGTPEEAAAAARDQLLEAWKDVYATLAVESDGYLEIRSTRVFTIAEHPEAFHSDGTPIERASMFDGMGYVVEFTLLTDFYNSAPYYINAGYLDHVILYRGLFGKSEAVATSPFRKYSGVTYSWDFSGIITEITDLGTQLNAVYHLTAE